MCKEHIHKYICESDECEISIYEDEGISGKTLDRPQFRQFMKIEESTPFDFLVVYRLDRVSRNVGDFSSLIEKLNSLGTDFISIKEKFDTSTPMGRAMMNIAAVFAQLERETIAERIKDNMYRLAKSGRWTGGKPPIGYKKLAHTYKDANGKEKTYFTLEIDEEQIELVKLIFAKYSELQSINAVEQYLNKTKNLTRRGNHWDKANVKRILTNPVYCSADKESLKYFTELGCNVCFDESDCDGKNGILPYSRHSGQKTNTPDKWLITVSTHRGLFSGAEWIRIQRLLEQNGKNKYGGINNTKRSLNPRSYLSGILVCRCGSYMRPKIYGSGIMYYMCENKEKTKKADCDNCNVNGDELDKLVMQEIFQYDVEGSCVNVQLSALRKKINSVEDDIAKQITKLKSQKVENEKSIKRLITAISTGANELTISHINAQIIELTDSNTFIDAQLTELGDVEKLQAQMHVNLNNVEEAIVYLKNNFEKLSIENKREFIKRIVEKVIWDGENASVFCKGSALLK